MRSRALRWITLTSTALLGLLVAHELDYRLIVPDPTHRHDLLLRTGHGYLSHLTALIALAALLAAAGSVAMGVLESRGRRFGIGRAIGFLAVVQSGGFIALEALERVIVGAPPGDRLAGLIAVGCAVQVLTASIGAVIVAVLSRAVAAIAEVFVLRFLASVAILSTRPCLEVTPGQALLAGAAGNRGPPIACA